MNIIYIPLRDTVLLLLLLALLLFTHVSSDENPSLLTHANVVLLQQKHQILNKWTVSNYAFQKIPEEKTSLQKHFVHSARA